MNDLTAPDTRLEFATDESIGFAALKKLPVGSAEYFSYQLFWQIHFVNRNFLSMLFWGNIGRGLQTLRLASRDRYFTAVSGSEAARRWDDDDFFTLQNTTFHNPEMIAACRELPSDVASVLARADLSQRVAAGAIFEVDHGPSVAPFQHSVQPGRVIVPSRCWYEADADTLRPLAIEAAGRITLPGAGADWVEARRHHQQCNLLNSQIAYHLLFNHVVVEVFSISMYRWLPPSHPMRFLLMPFVGSVPFVNNGFGKSLIYDRLVRHFSMTREAVLEYSRHALRARGYDYFDFTTSLAKRGMTDQPFYTFGAAGARWLTHMNEALDAILAVIYPTDDALAADAPLRQWAKEALVQLQWTEHVKIADWGRDMLRWILSGVLFSSSYRHSIYHYRFHEIMGVRENSPFHMNTDGTPPSFRDQLGREMVGCGLDFPNVLFELSSWTPPADPSIDPKVFGAVSELYAVFHAQSAALRATCPALSNMRLTTMSH